MTHYHRTESGLLVPFSPHIVRRNYLEAEAGHRNELAGEYRMVVRRADGSIKRDTGFFPNLILDSGLNRIGSGTAMSGCAIGTSAVAPSATQTALISRSAWTTTSQSNVSSAAASAPYYFQNDRTWRFALGALNGNFSEVGVGWSDTQMFSRALIVDAGGNPTPITVLSDEQLDVTYRLRMYVPTTDWGGTFTIGGTSTTVTGRSIAVTTNWWASWGPPHNNVPIATGITSDSGRAYAGPLGAITAGNPGGTYAGASSSCTSSAYVNNSLSRTGSVTFGLNDGNSATFKVLTVTLGVFGQIQYDFDPAIPKNNTRTLVFNLSSSWARRP
jgi:hypothetical protein